MSGLETFFEKLRFTGPWYLTELGEVRCGGRCPLEVVAGARPGGALRIAAADVELSREEFLDVMSAADHEPRGHATRRYTIRQRLLDLIPKEAA
jgi:hypothetical protein